MSVDEDTPKYEGRQEWRIVAPAGDEFVARTRGHLAIQMMASALGWDCEEIIRPTETDVSAEDIVEASKELFGDERYGAFANVFLDWLALGASAWITEHQDITYLAFEPSSFWLRAPTFESRLKVKKYAPFDKASDAAITVLDAMELPFRYDVHQYPRFRHQGVLPGGQGGGMLVGKAVPASITKEKLKVFLEKERAKGRSYAQHGMHGLWGGALDTLSKVAGINVDADASTVISEESFVPLDEFYAFAERNGVTKGVLRTLKDKLQNAARKQLVGLEIEPWGEVEMGLDTQIQTHWERGRGFKDPYVSSVSVATLAKVDASYTKITPALKSVLDAYKTNS